jgi:hypothetical protein
LDATSLDKLLNDSRDRQFWLKPIGFPKDHPDWDVFETRKWTECEIEIHFAKTPARIAVGAVLIAYRIHVSKLIFVAERLPMTKWSAPENRSAYSKRRWPYYIKGLNLTPEYGSVWNRYSFQPFTLAKEFNAEHSEDPVHLGGIQRGNASREFRVRSPSF